ncbi:MAG: putative zinc-binding metallopeptidase [Wenzhouxiangellaceae bacterium]|nr:putative zinc-binding metallopeptidase [Wenzhouxiangellaceae bacterium]
MKTFTCSCGNTVYFENTSCVRCGRELGFLPDVLELSAIEPAAGDRYRARLRDGHGAEYRKCLRYSLNDACNWMIPAEEPEDFCMSCRLSQVIPNLDKPGNRSLWIRIERRKRRLVYDLRRYRLPVIPKSSDPQNGLAFAFMEEDPGGQEFDAPDGSNRILTGHANGLITINIAEADTVEREKMRQAMNEAQRTLLGHFRHESAHYYWDRLVANGPMIESVRAVFGDEREDYAQALQRYYEQGPKLNWQDEFVSAYASAHPWEDWAECWAHLLQITDALETAVNIGMAPPEAITDDMDLRVKHWVQLATAINLLNRSLDQPDPYPFVLMDPVIEKLKVVDSVIRSSGFSD